MPKHNKPEDRKTAAAIVRHIRVMAAPHLTRREVNHRATQAAHNFLSNVRRSDRELEMA